MSIYDIRPDNIDGALWTVFDSRTLEPATMQGSPCIGLSLHEADSLADTLNQSHAQRLEPMAAD
ncbi:hypothetical protein AB1286_29485 [Trinickia sp. NRRL B-1857]|uniref:hypothetical protein n=1 Tax=Trinickia sp. NRRL B-1857 TaxID=3162879 RepID=UPI003D2B93C6